MLKFQAGLTLDGRERVLENSNKLASDSLIEKSDPEAFTAEFLIEPIFAILNIEKLPQKHFRGVRNDLRKVDYRLKHKDLTFLAEVKPLNADLFEKGPDGAVNQIKGLFRLAEVKENYKFGIATDGLKWIFVDRNSRVVFQLNLVRDFSKIRTLLAGEEEVSTERIEEEISKKFYDWYNALLHGGNYKDHEDKARAISKKDCLVENIVSIQSEDQREQLAQTIMDRLIFIKFLMAKQIVKDDVLGYLSTLDESILNEKLKQLFFDVFNTPREDRIEVDAKFKDIPYLNGSLFVRTAIETKSPDYRMRAFILRNIIRFLDSFRFVHAETNSMGGTLNPEILGYIFERAMTATDRKGTGAYYTPRAVTRYIAQNTLHPVVLKKTNKQLLAKGYKNSELLKEWQEVYGLRESTLRELFENILSNLKICDDACGSGAFLLACADAILEIYEQINEDLRLGYSEIDLRKRILKSNLYGVDINPQAIEIAKLRLWLWLVDAYEPAKVEALPNIDYNLRVGNSLIGYVDIAQFKLEKLTLVDWFSPEDSLQLLLEQREEKITKYKDFSGEEARKTKGDIDEVSARCRALFDNRFYTDFAKRLGMSVDEFRATKPFHWGFEFYDVFDQTEEDRGFDVIVGNPPYIRVESLNHKVADLYKSLYNSVHERCDIYVAFMQTSFQRINDDGMVGLITANQYMVAEYGRKIREILITDYDVKKIITFTHYSVFPGASIYTAILIGGKQPSSQKVRAVVFNSDRAISYMTREGLTDTLRHPEIETFDLDKESLRHGEWTLKSRQEEGLLAKVAAKCPESLGKLGLIGSPLKTGRDAVLLHALKKEEHDYYVTEISGKEARFEKAVWKKILRSRDLNRWKYKEPTKIVFFPYRKQDDKYVLIGEEDLKKYPLTYSFLFRFKDVLLNRLDSRKTWRELGREWWSLHRVGIPQNFEGPKILTKGEVREPKFCLDTKSYLFPCARIIGVSPHNGVSPYFLLAYLNSNLAFFIMKSKAAAKRGGYVSVDVKRLSRIPVPSDSRLAGELTEIAKEAVDGKIPPGRAEARINKIVNAFFDLSPDEISLVSIA